MQMIRLLQFQLEIKQIYLISIKQKKQFNIIKNIRRQVSYQDGQRLAQNYNLLFMETSAKTGDNIDKVVLKNNKKTISI